MIICDICNKIKPCVDSIVLFSQRVDFCKECSPYANKLKLIFDENMKYHNEEIKKTEYKLIQDIIKERRKDYGN